MVLVNVVDLNILNFTKINFSHQSYYYNFGECYKPLGVEQNLTPREFGVEGGNRMTVGNITSNLFADNYFHSSNVIKLTPENKPNNATQFNIKAIKIGDDTIDISNMDTVEISKEAREELTKFAASQNNINVMTPVSYPTSYGRFNEDGTFSTSAPVNFSHTSFDGLLTKNDSQDYFAQKGIINQDYVNQFNTILKDSNGDLKSGDNVLLAALNKYAKLKNSISASNLPDAETQIEQLGNSLKWSVGTSLNKFANDMTQTNTFVVKSPTYTEDNKIYIMMCDGGRIADDLFSVNNSSYKTATNIVFSAAKLTEKGVDYINNNQYDPENSEDASQLLSAMNNGTNDTDSSNLSLSTLTDVISTFRSFVYAPDQVVMSEADNLAQNAPSSDIAAIYINMKNRLNLMLSAHYGEGI